MITLWIHPVICDYARIIVTTPLIFCDLGEYYRGNLFGMFWNFPMPFKKWPKAVMPGLAWQDDLHSRVRPEMDACW
jgi:hypothetical protein